MDTQPWKKAYKNFGNKTRQIGRKCFLMSEKLKAKIGEELYNKVLEKGLKPEDLDIVNDGSWIPKPRFNEVNNKLKATEDKVTTYENQIKDYDKLVSQNKELKGNYDSLKEQHSNDLAAKDKEISNVSKRFMVEQKLRESGAKHTSLLMKDIDLEKITVENENLLGMDPILEGLKTNYGDMFITKQTNNNTSQSNNNMGGNDNQNYDPNNIDWEAELKDIK